MSGATATPVHRGRRTQVWQTRVETEEGKLVAATFAIEFLIRVGLIDDRGAPGLVRRCLTTSTE